MNLQEKIGSRIVSARELLKLKQKELAEACQISSARLSNWEVGNRLPKPQEIKKLAEVLKVSPAWLYCLSDDLRAYETQAGQVNIVPAIHLNEIKSEKFPEKLKISMASPTIESLNRYDFIPLKLSSNTDHNTENFAIIMTDESMCPEVLQGDTLIISPSVKPVPGNLVLAFIKDQSQAVVRKLITPSINSYKLISSNQNWPSYEGKNEDLSILIFGTVTALHRSM